MRERFRQAVNRAFQMAGTLRTTVTLQQRVINNYDPETGEQTIDTDEHAMRGIFDNYSKREIDGDTIQTGDRMFHVEPDQGLLPTLNDRVIDTDDSPFEIINITLDAAKLVATLQLRPI